MAGVPLVVAIVLLLVGAQLNKVAPCMLWFLLAAVIAVAALVFFIFAGIRLMRTEARLCSHMTQCEETQEDFRLGCDFAANKLPAGLVATEEAARREKAVSNDSHVIIMNPSEDIEKSIPLRDGQTFAHIVRENLKRGVSYTYLIADGLGASPRKKLEKAISPTKTSRSRLEFLRIKAVTGDDSDVKKLIAALMICTVTIYGADVPDRCSVILVAPGFDPRFALELPGATSARVCASVIEYCELLKSEASQ
jgi:hypothetical protein